MSIKYYVGIYTLQYTLVISYIRFLYFSTMKKHVLKGEEECILNVILAT